MKIRARGLSAQEKGGWAEAYALHWLLQRGVWVARNFSSAGPFDLVAVDEDGTVILLDVKFSSYKGKRTKRRSLRSYRVRTPVQKSLGVHLFLIDEDLNVMFEPELFTAFDASVPSLVFPIENRKGDG